MNRVTELKGWSFIGLNGDFTIDNPHKTSYLYFPLGNENGMMSSITPMLGGDIKTNQNSFLMTPVSSEDLHNSRSTRNFWLYIDGYGAWSAAGNSPKQIQEDEQVRLEAGLLWHKIIRENQQLGIKSEITNFVPVGKENLELMKVKITNNKTEDMIITPTCAIPVFGRSADNIRDHRHVTSLLNRINITSNGIIVKPTLSFDERGHKINQTAYGVFAAEGNGNKPVGAFPITEEFIGEGGSFEWPEAVVKNLGNYKEANTYVEGYEAVGALRFSEVTLKAGESISYIMALVIMNEDDNELLNVEKYCAEVSFEGMLEENRKYWDEKLSKLSFYSEDTNFDQWMKWVTVQPILRRIYGCSFLPHHDYGRGGRGWRDLWQDCLALLVMEPLEVRELLLNNYAGVRIDGSNATIIGNKPGEFIADRNNIPRIWMDHGAWPFLTTSLYINQSGDIKFLLENQTYFKDKQISRCSEVDLEWKEINGNKLKNNSNEVLTGTILEHILIEQLSPFFNVGEHNNILLEGADWNDAFDMADEKGESVAFTALYGSNLLELSDLLLSLKSETGTEKVEIASEMLVLLDSLKNPINYNSIQEKRELLASYFTLCKHTISGEKISVPIDLLVDDLKRKSQWIFDHIRDNEWVTSNEGFEWVNGYYDNNGEKLEGHHENGVRMTLTGQVFPIMAGIINKEQIEKVICSANQYLRDEKVGGYRLNSNFNEVKLNMGRGFGFAFGHKENGSMFSHMAVMYSNALYKRGFVREGFQVLNSIYNQCKNFEKSRIYPGIPEYVNEKGRGMYNYLTGSASWLLLTELNEVYGVKGKIGNLVLEPKLVKEQFNKEDKASVVTYFAEQKLKITYFNIDRVDFGQYCISSVSIGEKKLHFKDYCSSVVIDRKDIVEAAGEIIELIVELNSKKLH